ncbi:MAG: hypothetical protein B6I24_06700 [Bacteroidetes bacterium 4572_128]|nr:MAG: hypothetical protein B6I24_06700 [Bacteroidetes bacterium 4572_128]
MEDKFYKFSEINMKILEEISDFEQVRNQDIFKEWFNFHYEIEKSDEEFLYKSIKVNRYNIDIYSELQLQLHFINPLLNRIHFYSDNFRSWFQQEISGIVNGHKISGILDFMVASGTLKPKKPYFFIQEFKKSAPIPKHPKGQLFSQMAVAIETNKINKMRGAYNIGRFWFFVVLEKIKDGKYRYHESEAFNALKINDLKQIYIILKALKHKYCK